MSDYIEALNAKAIALLVIATANNHNGIDWMYAKEAIEGAQTIVKEIDKFLEGEKSKPKVYPLQNSTTGGASRQEG